MTAAAGASAYFSAPEQVLDPALFTAAGTLSPDVRDHILSALYDFFKHEGIQVGSWLHAWLAGSGVSYQWRASRGNGDLDVLLGIDPRLFAALNPDFPAGSRKQLSAAINEQMKKYLWPVTAATGFAGTTYEVTYYWDPEVTTDIRTIRPYAAWNLDTSRWDVEPDPQPAIRFPHEWHAAAGQDAARVAALYREWSQDLHDVLLLPATAPAHVTAESALRRVTAELRAIWDLLHGGRRSAFTGDGGGWGDWHNFRWQSAKANGTIGLLREVIRDDDQRRAAGDTRLYGGPIDPAEVALRRAAMSYRRWANR